MCIQQNVLEDTTAVNETDLNEMGARCGNVQTGKPAFSEFEYMNFVKRTISSRRVYVPQSEAKLQNRTTW
jgi:hypothetical protein